MADDIGDTHRRTGPQTGPGDGAAYRSGYGAGGLGSGADRTHHGEAAQNADPWDAPGVTPDGHRTGSSNYGPRRPMGGEADPEAD